MTDIYEIIKGIGIEIPEDKKDEFKKSFTANYKTVNEVENLKSKLTAAELARDTATNDLATRDADLVKLKEQLQNAGVDETKLKELNTKFAQLQETYNKETEDYKKKLNDQAYEFAVKEKTSNIKFTSNSAKKAFLADLLNNPLAIKDGEVMGFDDFVESYKKQDAGAFVVENPTDNSTVTPVFAGKTTPPNPIEHQPQPQTRKKVVW